MSHLPRMWPLATAALLALAIGGAAFGQRQQDPRTDLYKGPGGHPKAPQQVQQPLRIDDLNRLDPGIGDVSPLRRSLRDLPVGLQLPSGFSEVYAVPGRPGWFMRANGGLYAVFPQSIYAKEGAVVPYGTVFHIGAPVFPEDVLVGPDPARDEYYGTGTARSSPHSEQDISEERASYHPSVRQRAVATTTAQPRNRQVAGDASVGPSIIRDRNYRRIRLHELMRRAASAE